MPPSTRKPDLDNANVGTLQSARGTSKTGVPRDFYLGGNALVKVNGERKDIAGKTVSEYLLTTDYDRGRIAVERNGEIVFKSQYDSTVLSDGDTVEIVSFVGGS